MKPNEIKKWLRCSTTLGENENCPHCKYNTECLKGSSLEMATITYINQLEAKVKKYEVTIKEAFLVIDETRDNVIKELEFTDRSCEDVAVNIELKEISLVKMRRK